MCFQVLLTTIHQIHVLETPKSLASLFCKTPLEYKCLILRTLLSVNLCKALRTPRGGFRRPFCIISCTLSRFVPKNKCLGFTQAGTSHLCKTQSPSGIEPTNN